ncbi:MAG TPA: helix-turn-helix transcriptional regulator [Rhodothermales bacterium]|nr:helix-turn-helix transcriptional regulator [Rhodothermales bacterium]
MELLPLRNGFVILFLMGAVQGVFLAAVLASRKDNEVANRLLATLMLVFSLDLATAAYHASGYYEHIPYFIGIDYPLAFLYGPLLLLYVKVLSTSRGRLKKTDGWHFVPFLLLVLYLVPFYVQSGVDKLAFLSDPGSQHPREEVMAWVNHAKMIHGLGYVGLTFVLLKRHHARVKDTFTAIERINLVWLRNLLVGIVILASFTAVLYVLSLQHPTPTVLGLDPSALYDDFTLLGLTVFVYAIGYMGLQQPEVIEPQAVQPEPAKAKAQAYEKSGMEPEAAVRYCEALVELMNTEKPYHQGDLTLQDLADALGISAHNLTEVINTQLGQNFYDFVNSYRVREVQERLADPDYVHLTLLAIGLEAGFNSKSTFNAVFKKHTQMTPSQYRKQKAETMQV